MATGNAGKIEASITSARRTLREDLQWVVCPVCRSRLEVAGADGLTVEAVRCAGCRRTFPRVDGIAVLLADRATLYI